MENYINIHDLKANLSGYARAVMQGKRFIIASRNKPFAELLPLAPKKRKKPVVFGVLKGAFTVPDDFDSPVREFEGDFYR